MSNTNPYIQAFVGGELGRYLSARLQMEAYPASCDFMENWLSLAQGPMTRRAGLQFIERFTELANAVELFEFEFDANQNYLLLMRPSLIHFWLAEGQLFVPDTSPGILSSLTDASEAGASVTDVDELVTLTSNGAGTAQGRYTVTINDLDKVHVLRFEVLWGPIDLRLGTTAGGFEYARFERLRTGVHQIAVTPTETILHIEFRFKGFASRELIRPQFVLANSPYTLSHPWQASEFSDIRIAQDGNRVWFFSPRRTYVLERRGHYSWSLIEFNPDDGPFEGFGPNDIRLIPSGTAGPITLTASKALFDAELDKGRLYKLYQQGQTAQIIAQSDSVFSPHIRITGVGAERTFRIQVLGTHNASISLERSFGNPNNFQEVLIVGAEGSNYDNYVNDSTNEAPIPPGGDYDNALFASSPTEGFYNNQTVFYRLAIRPGNYTSGVITLRLSTTSGSTAGIVRIREVTSATEAEAEVLQSLGSDLETDIWEAGAWAGDATWPTIGIFAKGRLFVARGLRLWGSRSDNYFAFEAGTDDDHAIEKTIRTRSGEGIRWMSFIDYLLFGTRSEENLARSNSPTEPLAPRTFEVILSSEEGAMRLKTVTAAGSVIYAGRSGKKLFQFTQNPRALSDSSFMSVDLTRLNPEICDAGIAFLEIQQEPERRIIVGLNDGTVRLCLFRREEEIISWQRLTTNGRIVRAAVLAENDEDYIYFLIEKELTELNGDPACVYHLERLRLAIPLDDFDFVHLDSYLETPFDRRQGTIWPSALQGQNVVFSSDAKIFDQDDVGKILWLDGGRARIISFISETAVLGNVIAPLAGVPDDKEVPQPRPVPAGRHGIAVETTLVSGLDHLIGKKCQIWADLAYMGDAVVNELGQIELPTPASRIFVGEPISSRWRSLKLAYGQQKGSAVFQRKRPIHLHFHLLRSGDGLEMGRDFENMEPVITTMNQYPKPEAPKLFTGEVVNRTFNADYQTDPRICLRVRTPHPCTVAGIGFNIQTIER